MKVSLKAYNISFEEDERFMLENIETYLNSLTATTLAEDFQYLPIKLYQTIKIPINQQKLNPLSLGNPFYHNYLRVYPSSTDEAEHLRIKPSYYFIKGSRWISRECIELELKLDTLNTLPIEEVITRRNYIIDKKTLIRREHKNRIRTYGNEKYFKIDKVSEGITPTLYNTNKQALFHENTSSILHNFYLIYMNSLDDPTQPNNAVRAYLTMDNNNNNLEALNITYQGFTSPITPTQLNEDVYYYIIKEGTNTTITFTNIGGAQISYTPIDGEFIRFKYIDGKIEVFSNNHLGTDLTYSIAFSDTSYKIYYSTTKMTRTTKRPTEKIKDMPFENLGASSRSGIVLPMNQVDRTNPQIIKIIKLPYSPRGEFIYNPVDNSVLFSYEDYSFDSARQLLYINDINNLFYSKVKAYTLSNVKTTAIANVDINAPRSIENEPKLYHSDFAYKKLVYDSFSLMIRGEDLTAYGMTARTPYINFYCTTTINSRFIFEIDETYGEIFENTIEDYPNTLSINRNNEITLYNNEYINYIKNGYNYDKKKQQRQEIVGAVSSAVGALGALGSGLIGGNFGASSFVNLSSSSAKSIIGTINQHIEAEATMEQKIKQLENQATAVRGADDADLLEVYNKNKLWVYDYSCSEEMKNNLYDLFYYTGYKCDYMGVPNLNTRYWFNYIECDLNLRHIKPFIELDVIDDLKDKFSKGMTYFHLHNGVYDLEQEKENWEVELINE